MRPLLILFLFFSSFLEGLTSEDHRIFATALWKEKREVEAYVHFLQALDKDERSESLSQSQKECFDQLMDSYYNSFAYDPKSLAQEFLDEHKKEIETNVVIAFFAAHAYATLGNFEEFVLYFTRTYPYFKDTYLSLRAEGIISLKISKVHEDEEMRNRYHQRGVSCLQKALEICDRDPHLRTLCAQL